RAGGDEKNVVGFDHSMFGLDVRSFDDRQQIALYSFARDIRAASSRTTLARNLIDLVEEDDAHRLYALQRIGGDVFLVDQFFQLFAEEDAARLRHLDAALFLALGQH